MRYSVILMLPFAFMPVYAFSQQSLQNQIEAVEHADADQQATEQAAKKTAVAEQKARIAKEQALREAKKNREQAYEDNLRQVQLDSLKMDLEAKKAQVSRTNEYIDQDLKQKAATTDVIQSNADATRNITSGMKDEMESEGKAKEKQAKGFWSF